MCLTKSGSGEQTVVGEFGGWERGRGVKKACHKLGIYGGGGGGSWKEKEGQRNNERERNKGSSQ